MKITRFYSDELGANLANVQWSWGAVHPMMNRVFLRVWQDEIESTEEGEQVLLLRKPPRRQSSGYPERIRHLDAIRKGAQGFGIVCVPKKPLDADKRTIVDFNREQLLVFGHLIENDDAVMGQIMGRVPVADLATLQTAQSTLIPDVKAILSRKSDSTVKEALVDARVGQGWFRAQVLLHWDGRCAVTGCAVQDAIRASHIKPWRLSTDEERLNPLNGLPLLATFDALFDAGLITFAENGEMLVSDELPASERSRLGVDACRLSRQPSAITASYLAFHRAEIFRLPS